MVLRRIGEVHLLVPISGEAARSNHIYPLNPTGAFVWERLAAGKTLSETAREVSRAFEVTEEQAEADCREYAGLLVEEGLLEIAS